ncbi:ATP-binding cassette, sub-B (MDR TAP), member 8, partial [Chytriomyces hyalinus]
MLPRHKSKFKNLAALEKSPLQRFLESFNPVDNLIHDIEHAFGDTMTVFYDMNGGDKIGLLVNKKLVVPQQLWKVNIPYTVKPQDDLESDDTASKAASGADKKNKAKKAKALVVPDYASMGAEIERMGMGLIVSISTNFSLALKFGCAVAAGGGVVVWASSQQHMGCESISTDSITPIQAGKDLSELKEVAPDEDSMELDLSETKKDSANTWQIIKHIAATLKPDALLLFAIVAATGATAAVNIVTPMVIGDLVSTIQLLAGSELVTQDQISAINGPALRLLALFITQGLLTCIDINLVTRLGERLSLRLKHDLYASLLAQDMAFFDNHMQGEVVGRLTQDISEFKHTFKLVITQGLKCFTQIIFTSIHLLQVSRKLSLALLGTMPFLYIGMNLYGIFLRKLSKEARQGDSLASGVAGEAISNVRTVRAFAAEDRELERYMDAASDASGLNNWLGFHIALFQGVTNSAIGGMILVILSYGGSLVGSGELTGGQLMTYMISTQNAQRSLASLGVLFGQGIKALGSAARIFEYIHLEPSIGVREGALVPNTFQGSIEFKNVSFRYPTRPDQIVLDQFNLAVPVGKVVALCGASGSGKSTVGQLIERFYDTTSGAVLIDGVDVRKLDPTWIRTNIGYIHQEPVLFATSIYENIRYGAPNATRAQVEEAARKANAADFITGFPNGYDTVVGERGVTLSGGQKQRIAIA